MKIIMTNPSKKANGKMKDIKNYPPIWTSPMSKDPA